MFLKNNSINALEYAFVTKPCLDHAVKKVKMEISEAKQYGASHKLHDNKVQSFKYFISSKI